MTTMNANSINAEARAYDTVTAPVSAGGPSPWYNATRLEEMSNKYKEDTEDYVILRSAAVALRRSASDLEDHRNQLGRFRDECDALRQHLQTIKFVVNA